MVASNIMIYLWINMADFYRFLIGALLLILPLASQKKIGEATHHNLIVTNSTNQLPKQ